MNAYEELEGYQIKLVEELTEWGALEGFAYADWPGGRSYYLLFTRQPELEVPEEQLSPVLYAVRAGWLAARAGGLPEVGAEERKAIDEGASSYRYSRNLKRIREAGGALAEELEAASAVRREAEAVVEAEYGVRHPEYWEHKRDLSRQFEATVERLAAELEG